MNGIEMGSPQPLGATRTAAGVNFAVFSSHADRIEVRLFSEDSGQELRRFDLPGHTGDIWHGLAQSESGVCYALHAHGPHDPANGHRFEAALPLLDPYARSVSRGRELRARLHEGAFDWAGQQAPRVPWRDSVIYELHVKGFTQQHPDVPAAWRGKYLGLTAAPVIEHLRSLGVTAVQLLPCQAFIDEPVLIQRKLSNYWGYNPIAWFAPAHQYAVNDAAIEFKTMVKALHAAGIEVILDVVFNHTGEGDEKGPTLSFRGLDNAVYYRLAGERHLYENLTGCGNTVNCQHPQVRELILDCLRYWVQEMHVDGFRFDLATVLGREADGFNARAAMFDAMRAEPCLEGVKLIAEPWDVGWGGYQLGRFPRGWAEWNDRFRDGVRSFWRGDSGRRGELAQRISGSSELFEHDGRHPTAGVNFFAAHDGFTLRDLVSYNERHNEANLENNADGHRENLSWNCGIEGPSSDPRIETLRAQQMRNFAATLFVSLGVPMLQAGDEFGRSQQGNNNAYCQDNALSWVDWRLREVHGELLEFVRLTARLRRRHAELRRESFLCPALPDGRRDAIWFNGRGDEMSIDEWADPQGRALGVLHAGDAKGLLVLFNAGDAAQTFCLPPAPARPWKCLFDTAMREDRVAFTLADHYPLAPRSVALLEC